MSNKEEKKQFVITGRTVLCIIALLAVVAALIVLVTELVRGTPILDILTENPVLWVGAIGGAIICVSLGGKPKKDE